MRVPEYRRDVSLRPSNRQGVDVQASPDAFGAAQGRGLESLGQGVANLASSVQAVQDLEDTMRAKEADNNYANWMREAMYGDGGYMTLEGRNAIDARADFERIAGEKRKEFGSGLSAGASRHYQNASNARLQSTLQRSAVHAAGERKTWFKQSSDARMATFADDALAVYDNPAEAKKHIAAGVMELRQKGTMLGWDADMLGLQEREFVSGVHKAIALRLAQDDPLRAEEYVGSVSEGLTEADKVALKKSLEEPVYAAKGQRNAQEFLNGIPPANYDEDDSGALPPATDAERPQSTRALDGEVQPPVRQSFMDVAEKVAGLHEGRNAAAISDFIRRSAGINIDPRVTPWCSAFVNAVLGAQGIEGTGKLNARSFLSFGVPTDAPRPGDIVVLSRGNSSWQGHVGFFQGFDSNGNIRVFGGNQSNAVNVSSYPKERLLGYRRAGQVSEGTIQLPNYSPQGLGAIYDRLSKIKDPKEMEATRKALDAHLTLRKKAMDAQRDQVQGWVEQQIAADPSTDLMRLPPEIRNALGASGMTTMLNYQEKLRSAGDPETDQRLMYDLQVMDPDELVETDIFQYRDRLAKSDWEKVRGWKASALQDKRKARDENAKLKQAFSLATTQLRAAGVVKQPNKMSDADHARVAQFNQSLASEIEAFKRDEKNGGRNPTDLEVQSMINRLLLPVVTSEAGRGWFGWDRETESRLFEAGGQLGEIEQGVTVKLDVDYDDIPVGERVRFEGQLRGQLGRQPTEDEVEAFYAAFLRNTNFKAVEDGR